MTFRETPDKHLAAIHNRDLDALRETLPGEWLTLITSDGRLVTSAGEFLRLHADWFGSPTWSLEATPVSVLESPELGVAVPHLDYRDRPPGKPPIYETSYLTLRSRAGLFPPSPPKRGRGGKNQDRVLGVPAPGLSEPRP